MAKGGSFERDMCKSLSIWWSRGIRDDIFWRTAGSGARATQRAKQGKITSLSYGDVTSNHPFGKTLLDQFVIEIKRGYTSEKSKKSKRFISLLDMIDTNCKQKTKPLLVEWWNELERDILNTQSPNMRGLLICRRDRRQSFIVMHRSTFKDLSDKKPCIYPFYNPGCWLQAYGLNVQIMKLSDFFYWIEPELLGGRRFIRRLGEKTCQTWIKPGPYPSLTKNYFEEIKKAVNVI